MASVVQRNFRIRHNYGQVQRRVEVPNLIDLQKKSYERFLQRDVPEDQREDVGLHAVFKNIFPIEDPSRNFSLEYESYRFEEPIHDVSECLQRAATYQARLKVKIRAVTRNPETNEIEEASYAKDDDYVFMGEIPLQTDEGTFIINGTERVVVSQLHRSPGAFFNHDQGKGQGSKLIYNARIIPYRGSWIDLEFDSKDILHIRIDRRRKMNATLILRAMGYTTQEIMNLYYPAERVEVLEENPRLAKRYFFHPEYLKGATVVERRTLDIKAEKKALKGFTRKVKLSSVLTALKKHYQSIDLTNIADRITGLRSADQRLAAMTDHLPAGGHWLVADEVQGEHEVRVNIGDELSWESIDAAREEGLTSLTVFDSDDIEANASIRAALSKLAKGVDGLAWGFTHQLDVVTVDGEVKVICEAGAPINRTNLLKLAQAGVKEAEIFCADGAQEMDLMRGLLKQQLKSDDVSSWHIAGDLALNKDGSERLEANVRLSLVHLVRLAVAGHNEVPLYRSVTFSNERKMKRSHGIDIKAQDYVLIKVDELKGAVLAEDAFSPETGDLLKGFNEELGVNEETMSSEVDELIAEGVRELKVYFIDDNHFSGALRQTLISDAGRSRDAYESATDDHPDVLEMRDFIENLRLDVEETGDESLDLFGYRAELPASELVQIAGALKTIYNRIRPGDPAKIEAAYKVLKQNFFIDERYDLSEVGRIKLNHKFKLNVPTSCTTLTREDIVEAIRYIVALRDDNKRVYRERESVDGERDFTKLDVRIDDIDHLGNRRVRAVGELMENQFRLGLVRMERQLRDRLQPRDEERSRTVNELINHKSVSGAVKEYFGSSQLSQFMDQTNPLSEVTHKRRLSALGPGGLSRDRAGFEVRDVHMTHYGRICPIETPEGPNIGLISSLSTYAKINNHGFIETPYRKVKLFDEEGNPYTKRSEGAKRAQVDLESYRYFNALDEEYLEELWEDSPNRYNSHQHIAQAKVNTDSEGWFLDNQVTVRAPGDSGDSGDFFMVPPHEINLVDVSPNQLVSVAASLIPFLENDDANRALMGSNMQRQAVPLLVTRSPLVGTGMEEKVGRDSGVTVVAQNDGVVESVDANRIVIRVDDEEGSAGPEVHRLVKFRRSNQNTCINQRPIIERGERVKKGDIIADGPSTEQGELALGRNAIVAFMPWGGYNFEDSILISERLVQEDVYTSIHIEEFECSARETKLGAEEITFDIPSISEEARKKLDGSGIIRIGSQVKAGDILVGKTTPKGETQLTPEERLNQAIFGSKAKDVTDSSLRVRTGVVGTVIGVKVFNSKEEQSSNSDRARGVGLAEEAKYVKEANEHLQIIMNDLYHKLRGLYIGNKVTRTVRNEANQILIKRNEILTEELLAEIESGINASEESGARRAERKIELLKLMKIKSEGSQQERIDALLGQLETREREINEQLKRRRERLREGDDLAPGVRKMVKVYVAIKRKLQVGDKMAGRHGNKGVISRVLPIEDMPFLEDGTPVEMVLNPLGVPSRMNIGQILETHLGWAARGLGVKINRMLESGVVEDQLRAELKQYFTSEEHQGLIDQMNLEDLQRMIRGLREGIHVASPVFDGAPESQLKRALELAGLRSDARSVLFDGRTGRVFDNLVTVGIMYVLKLHHLVDEKIHARSVGPYSLVTQQPLGGKAQLGGQRLGEMEVWAMEAYGAAYTLQEFLTVKSDDLTGRNKMYQSIVHGTFELESGLPESFRVLIQELKSLALNVEMLNLDDE